MGEPLRTAYAEPPRFPHPPAADLDPPGHRTGRQLRCLPPASPIAARTAECLSGCASVTHSCRIPFTAIPHPLGSGAKDAPLPPQAQSPSESKVPFCKKIPPPHVFASSPNSTKTQWKQE